MRRFILLIITLLLLCTASLGTAILIGRQKPLPERIRALHLTDCVPPCWIGIVPGQTTMDEARSIITDTFKQSPYTFVWDIRDSTNLAFHLFKYANDKTPTLTVRIDKDSLTDHVGFINFNPESYLYSDLIPTTADLVILWNAPACVDMREGLSLIYNNEAGRSVMVISIVPPYEIDSPIFSFWISTPFPNFCADNELSENRYMKTWRGFSARHYYQP